MNKNVLIAIAVVVAGLALWLLYVVLSAPVPTNTIVKTTAFMRESTPVIKPSRYVAQPSSTDSVKTSVEVVSGNVQFGVNVLGK